MKTRQNSRNPPRQKIFYYYSVAAHPLFFTIAVLAAFFLKPISQSQLGSAGELISGLLLFVAVPSSLFYAALKRKEITLNLDEQEKRSKFFLPWAAVFLAAYFFYQFYGARTHASLSVCFAAVNLFLHAANKHSKISWHTTGLSAMATALAYSYGSALAALYLLLIPSVAYARYKLGAHSLGQLAVGAAAGTVMAYASFLLTAAPSLA